MVVKVFIGAAWPYASGPRHLGHLAGAFLPADVLARYHRLAGDDVLFVSGSDQFGTPITVAAERAGVPPAEFAHAQHEAIARSLRDAGISFDHYTATTSPEHRATVHELFGAIRQRGLVVEGEDVGAWCPQHRRSLPDRYVEGGCPRCDAPDARGDQCDNCGSTLDPVDLIDPRCRSCAGAVEFRPQRHLFLRLDEVAGDVAGFLASRSGDWRPWVAEEAAGALRTGLRSRAITRDLDWGVTVPLDGWDDRRFYVWFDAVIGYLSASREARPDDWQSWWCSDDARHLYVVGKDNVWFHALWWPAILLATGRDLHLPDVLVASQFLTEAGTQLSTSRGHGTTVDDAIARAGVDPLRHALVALSPERADASFSWDAFDDLSRTGLLGSIVNPAHRVATLIWKRFGGALPSIPGDRTEAERALADIGNAYAGAEFRAALRLVHDLGRDVNRRLAATEPWREPDDARAAATLAGLVPLIDALAVAAWPVVPDTAGRIRAAFGRCPEPEGWRLPAEPVAVRAHPEPPLKA